MHALKVLRDNLHIGLFTQVYVSLIAILRPSLDDLLRFASVSRFMQVDLFNLVPTTFYGPGMPIAATPTPTPTPTPSPTIMPSPSPEDIQAFSQMWSSIVPSWVQGHMPSNVGVSGLQLFSSGQPASPWSFPVMQGPMLTGTAFSPVQASAHQSSLFSAFPGMAQGFGSMLLFAASVLISLWAVGGWAVWGGVWHLKSKDKKL